MFVWIAENYPTILVCMALAGIVAAIVAKLIRDKKNGRTSCGCGCANCAMAGSCHAKSRQAVRR